MASPTDNAIIPSAPIRVATVNAVCVMVCVFNPIIDSILDEAQTKAAPKVKSPSDMARRIGAVIVNSLANFHAFFLNSPKSCSFSNFSITSIVPAKSPAPAAMTATMTSDVCIMLPTLIFAIPKIKPPNPISAAPKAIIPRPSNRITGADLYNCVASDGPFESTFSQFISEKLSIICTDARIKAPPAAAIAAMIMPTSIILPMSNPKALIILSPTNISAVPSNSIAAPSIIMAGAAFIIS